MHSVHHNKPALRTWLVNLLLAAGSIAALLLVLEGIVFRLVFVAPDVPLLDFQDQVLKYRPGQKGVYRVRDEVTAAYRINANGWNSAHDSYAPQRSAHKYRIAVIGDSYVEARLVNVDESLAEQLEKKLGRQRCEVYRFGIRGAPLSQYLHMLRREVVRYRPDLVVVVLIHNDFNESYQPVPGVYTDSFMKVQIEGGRVVREIPPRPLQKRWYHVVRARSAIWRYWAYRRQVRFDVLKQLILPGQKQTGRRRRATGEHDNNAVLMRYVFGQLQRICRAGGMRLLMIMDGDRNAIYAGHTPDSRQTTRNLRLNALAGDIARELGIDFIDLHPVFVRDYTKNGRAFNFSHDGHWNAYGHGIAAAALRDYIATLMPDAALPDTDARCRAGSNETNGD